MLLSVFKLFDTTDTWSLVPPGSSEISVEHALRASYLGEKVHRHLSSSLHLALPEDSFQGIDSSAPVAHPAHSPNVLLGLEKALSMNQVFAVSSLQNKGKS